jgi:BlaI family transcriptional regulator, penicillinase repressor
MPASPSDAELEILQVLWRHGRCTVRFIHEQIATRREVGYTTTLKQLQRMTEKKFVQQHKTGKSHEYTALLPEQEVKGSLVQRLIDTAFQGSTQEMLLHALGQGKAPTDEELEALEAWIKQQRDSDQ